MDTDDLRKVGAAFAATALTGAGAASGIFPVFCLAGAASVALLYWAAD